MNETKRKQARLGLLVSEDTSYGSYAIVASVVTVGPVTQWDSEITEHAIRNVPDSTDYTGGLYLDDFQARAWGYTSSLVDATTPRELLYLDAITYSRPYGVTLRKARLMLRTLETVAKRIEKLDAQVGRAGSFGAYLARVARAVGADRFVFLTARHGSRYSDNEHQFDSIADGAARIDRLAAEWIATGQDAQTRRDAQRREAAA